MQNLILMNLQIQRILKKKIENKEDIFKRDQYYEKIEIDDNYPDYIKNNLKKLKDWIL